MSDRQNRPDSRKDAAISDLYRTTRKEEPAGRLDAMILARAEVATQRRRRRWWLPVSSAAVLLLGVTLTLQLMEQAPRLPQSLEEVEADRPVEAEAARPIKKKQISSDSAPAMMMDSLFKADSEARGRRQEEAPLPPLPSREALQGVGPKAESKLLEAETLDLGIAQEDRDPAAWLAYIQTLLDQGDETTAVQELEAFSARYPEHPIPAKLQPLSIE
ncbi:MAG: hypothetical protein QNJ78_10060 [Gammaproteobacteria bacterium]|nr:hypothetical protein [Gammaproteobacteria bacterium]